VVGAWGSLPHKGTKLLVKVLLIAEKRLLERRVIRRGLTYAKRRRTSKHELARRSKSIEAKIRGE